MLDFALIGYTLITADNGESEVSMGLSMTEILVIIAVILILFGAKKIPELARSLGRASYEFKKAKEDLVKETRELKDAAEDNAEAADQTKQPEEKKEGK